MPIPSWQTIQTCISKLACTSKNWHKLHFHTLQWNATGKWSLCRFVDGTSTDTWRVHSLKIGVAFSPTYCSWSSSCTTTTAAAQGPHRISLHFHMPHLNSHSVLCGWQMACQGFTEYWCLCFMRVDEAGRRCEKACVRQIKKPVGYIEVAFYPFTNYRICRKNSLLPVQ